MLPPYWMLTIKKRGLLAITIVTLTLLTACGPAGPRALVKGERLLASGKAVEAIPKFEEATRLLAKDSPENQAQAWNWLGVARHEAGQSKAAMEAYLQAIKLDRNLAAANYNLGYLQFEQRNYPAAIDAWNTYLLKPKDAEGKEAEVLLQIGTAYLHQAVLVNGAEKRRQLDQARKNLEDSNKISQNAEALNQLGLVMLLRNRSSSEALAKFNEALRVQPNYPPALLNMAIVHHEYVRDHRIALKEYQDYLALKPAPANSKEVEVIASALARELAPAPQTPPPAPAAPSANATNRTVPPEKSPEKPAPTPKAQAPSADATPEPLKSVFTATTSGEKNTTFEARPVEPTVTRYNYPSFAQPTPGNRAEAVRLAGQAWKAKQKNNLTAAIDAYRSAIKADPSYFDAYYNLSGLERDNGEITASLDTLDHALVLRPDSAEARYAFAWSLEKSKYPQDAVHELEKLLKENPNNSRAQLLTANIYSQDLHQSDLARPHYQKVLELDPQHPQSAAIRSWLTANP